MSAALLLPKYFDCDYARCNRYGFVGHRRKPWPEETSKGMPSFSRSPAAFFDDSELPLSLADRIVSLFPCLGMPFEVCKTPRTPSPSRRFPRMRR